MWQIWLKKITFSPFSVSCIVNKDKHQCVYKIYIYKGRLYFDLIALKAEKINKYYQTVILKNEGKDIKISLHFLLLIISGNVKK